MNRLAYKLNMDVGVLHASRSLLDSEGTCVCGRVLRRLDAKFILINAVPSMGQMVMAAYCDPCSGRINRTLKGLRQGTYHKTTETAPVEIIKAVK